MEILQYVMCCRYIPCLVHITCHLDNSSNNGQTFAENGINSMIKSFSPCMHSIKVETWRLFLTGKKMITNYINKKVFHMLIVNFTVYNNTHYSKAWIPTHVHYTWNKRKYNVNQTHVVCIQCLNKLTIQISTYFLKSKNVWPRIWPLNKCVSVQHKIFGHVRWYNQLLFVCSVLSVPICIVCIHLYYCGVIRETLGCF